MRRIKRKELDNIKTVLLEEQGYRCPICGMFLMDYPMRDICVDHDHTTGVIRAALCRNCNRSEGKIKTLATCSKRNRSILEWLKSLVAYWEHHLIPRTSWIHYTHKTEEEKKEKRRAYAREYRKKKTSRTAGD